MIGTERRSLAGRQLVRQLITAPEELTSQAVRFAVIPQTRLPVIDDYVLGEWEDDAARLVATYPEERWQRVAQILVGPGGGDIVVTIAGRYGVWVKLTGAEEEVILDPRVCGWIDFF